MKETELKSRDILNPYAPGPGTPPPYLAGREEELHRFEVLFLRAEEGKPVNHLLFSGLRGVGKTVLMMAAREKAQERGWAVVKVEGDDTSSALESLKVQLEDCSELLQEKIENSLKEKIKTAFTSFKISVGPLSAEAKLREDERTTNVTPYLTKLVVVLGEAARTKSVGLLLVLDEMHLLDTWELKAILASIHETNQRKLPVALICAGLPQLPSIIQNAKTYSERMAIYSIGSLNEEEAKESIFKPALEFGVQFSPEALNKIYKETAGYPYFLQLIGELVFGKTEGNLVSEDDVDTLLPEYRQRLDSSFFAGRYQRATPKQREYLAAMAKLIEGTREEAVMASDVSALFGVSINQLSRVRDDLIKKGLIFGTERGLVGFTVPLFSEYMFRAHKGLIQELFNNKAAVINEEETTSEEPAKTL